LTEIIVLERGRAEVAVNAAYEQAEAEEALAQKLEQVNLRLLELDGRAGEARAQEIATKYNDLIEKLKANNDQAGLELVHKLINVEEARAAMQQIRDDFSQSVADMQAAEQSIQAQQQTNAITALEAESQIRALREQAAVQLTQLRDKMQELHEVTKDPEVARALQEMNTQLVQIEGSTNQWMERLKSSSVGGFKQFLIDVSEDADNAKDAFNNMAKSIVSSMRDMAAQAISENIMDLLFKGVSTGAAGGTGGGFAAMLSAFFQHSGGMVGSGRRRQVPAFAFAGAPRLHSGGYLKANEVPTVLEKGEEVLAKDDPRNAANGGGGTRILNVIDPALVHDYLASADGEKTIINTIRRNAGTVNQILV